MCVCVCLCIRAILSHFAVTAKPNSRHFFGNITCFEFTTMVDRAKFLVLHACCTMVCCAVYWHRFQIDLYAIGYSSDDSDSRTLSLSSFFAALEIGSVNNRPREKKGKRAKCQVLWMNFNLRISYLETIWRKCVYHINRLKWLSSMAHTCRRTHTHIYT